MEEDLPAQSYFEQFEEHLADGCFEAERLTQVVSAREEKDQKALKPEPARQCGLHLDSTLTIQIKRRFLSTIPTTTEQFRAKYRVMSNCWLLAKFRQWRMTFPRFCDELLSQKNFLLDKEFGPKRIAAQDWDICMAYELEVDYGRGLPIRTCLVGRVRKRPPKDGALAKFPRCRNWRLSSSANEDPRDKRIVQLEKKVGDLSRQSQNARSRSPRGNRNSKAQLALNAPAQLALLAPPKGKKNKSRRGEPVAHVFSSTDGPATQPTTTAHSR